MVLLKKGDEEDSEPELNIPDMTKIYEAIADLLELTIFVSKMNEKEESNPCKNGDLRDWTQIDNDYTDEFKEELK